MGTVVAFPSKPKPKPAAPYVRMSGDAALNERIRQCFAMMEKLREVPSARAK